MVLTKQGNDGEQNGSNEKCNDSDEVRIQWFIVVEVQDGNNYFLSPKILRVLISCMRRHGTRQSSEIR